MVGIGVGWVGVGVGWGGWGWDSGGWDRVVGCVLTEASFHTICYLNDSVVC